MTYENGSTSDPKLHNSRGRGWNSAMNGGKVAIDFARLDIWSFMEHSTTFCLVKPLAGEAKTF